ncbi:unnamed protein product [Brachionus calyciflorus]|uniref:Uncharacterized protein n=1 Tax=Brachionus calyciflorus TaxID=104777 RepID=A0A813ZHQ7_9BILA|nr:unnamed protein product [Brachionus calyciflorus]
MSHCGSTVRARPATTLECEPVICCEPAQIQVREKVQEVQPITEVVPKVEVRRWNEIIPREEIVRWNEVIPREEVIRTYEVKKTQQCVPRKKRYIRCAEPMVLICERIEEDRTSRSHASSARLTRQSATAIEAAPAQSVHSQAAALSAAAQSIRSTHTATLRSTQVPSQVAASPVPSEVSATPTQSVRSQRSRQSTVQTQSTHSTRSNLTVQEYSFDE